MSEVALNLLIDSLLIKLLCRFVNFEVIKKNLQNELKKIMQSFKSSASKIKNPRFFFNKSPDVILNKPPFVPPPKGRRGAVNPFPPPRTPLHVPDLKYVLEGISDDKNAFLIFAFFSSKFRSFHVHSFTNRSNIFKNAFYVFVLFFGTMGLFFIIPQERRPALARAQKNKNFVNYI